MEARGILEVREIFAAQWLHVKPRPVFAVLGVLLIALAMWALWFAFFDLSEHHWGGWLLLTCIAVLLLQFLVYAPYNLRRQYSQRKDLQRELAFVTSDAGLSIQTDHGAMSTPWQDYLKWKEGRTLFLLYLSDAMFQIVPKRFFASASDVDAFRDTLRSRVTNR
jgi:hypothetical protein